MAQFLQGNKTTGAIAWLDKHETTLEGGIGPNRGLVPTFLLRALAPVTVIPLLISVGIAISFYKSSNLASSNIFDAVRVAVPKAIRELFVRNNYSSSS